MLATGRTVFCPESTCIEFLLYEFDLRLTQDRQGRLSFFITVAIVFLDDLERFNLLRFVPLAEAFPLPYTIYAKRKLESVIQVMIAVHLVCDQDGIHEVRQASIYHEGIVLLLGHIVHHDVYLGVVYGIEIVED
jgi:hypothetical protein